VSATACAATPSSLPTKLGALAADNQAVERRRIKPAGLVSRAAVEEGVVRGGGMDGMGGMGM
jgi:hypothetical protein